MAAVVLLLALSQACPASFKVFPADYMHSSPSRGVPAHTLASLKMTAATGEYETGSFIVHADDSIPLLKVACGGLTNRATGRRIPLACRFLAYAWLDSAHTREVPFCLRDASPAPLGRDGNRQFFFTLVSSDTGLFTGSVSVNGISLPVSFYVHPFRLADGIFTGAFLGGLQSLDAASVAGMKAHNIDGIQFFWNNDADLVIRNVNHRAVVEFNALDSVLRFMKQAGMKGPVVPSIGNAKTAHMERDICRAFPEFKLNEDKRALGTIRTGPLNNPAFDSLLIDVLRQVRVRIESYGLEMVLIIYDEPTLFPLFKEFQARFRLIKAAMPGLRTYGVVMDSLAIAERMAPFCHIISANGDFDRIRELTRKKNLGAYFYAGASADCQAGESRGRLGFRFVNLWPDGIWFWAYNYYDNDPYVLYDGKDPDITQAVVFPAKPAPLGTPAYEGIREANDDIRYAATLKVMLEGDSSVLAKEIRGKLNARFEKIDSRLFEEIPCRDFAFMDSTRALLAGWIMELNAALKVKKQP